MIFISNFSIMKTKHINNIYYMFPRISEEQNDICVKLESYNVYVDCVAGSCKTTTAIHIAKKYKNLSM